METKLIIPETHPSINTWSHWHFHEYNKEKKRWAELVGWVVMGANRPSFAGKVEVEVRYYFKTKAKHDIDNYTPKFIMDPLVAMKVIEDDNNEIVTALTTKLFYDNLHPRTEVTIKSIA